MKKAILLSLAGMLFAGVVSAQTTPKKDSKAPVTKAKNATTTKSTVSNTAKVSPSKTTSVSPANKPATTLKRKHHPAKKSKSK